MPVHLGLLAGPPSHNVQWPACTLVLIVARVTALSLLLLVIKYLVYRVCMSIVQVRVNAFHSVVEVDDCHGDATTT